MGVLARRVHSVSCDRIPGESAPQQEGLIIVRRIGLSGLNCPSAHRGNALGKGKDQPGVTHGVAWPGPAFQPSLVPPALHTLPDSDMWEKCLRAKGLASP